MDLPSDSDESDVDFVPGVEESLSEAESEVDKETDAQYDREVEIKKDKKRLLEASSRKKKSKRIKKFSEPKEDSKPAEENEKDPVVQKKYEDDLWASFLDAPTPAKKSAEKVEKMEINTNKPHTNSDENDRFGLLTSNNETSLKSTDIFDLDNIKTTDNNKPVAKSSTSEEKNDDPIPPGPKVRNSGGGLSSILSKIGKNNKISTLEKSKLDWNSFKRAEGIEDEVVVHNRGRNGYLDRQDFLERTDHRQFELEKSLRANKRTKR